MRAERANTTTPHGCTHRADLSGRGDARRPGARPARTCNDLEKMETRRAPTNGSNCPGGPSPPVAAATITTAATVPSLRNYTNLGMKGVTGSPIATQAYA